MLSRRQKKPPACPGLAQAMRQIAGRLCCDFAAPIEQDPQEFKAQAVFYLRRHLPPGPGRPSEDAITKAINLRKQGVAWKQIYPQCIPDHSQLPPAVRRQAEENLRAARRSRRNAKKRRKPPGSFFAETIPPPIVPSGLQAEPAGK